MIRLFTILIFSILFFSTTTVGQGAAFGIKGGATMAFQKWDNSDRDPLIGYHFIGSVETLAEEGEFSMFAQLGYHTRGSAIRIPSFNYDDRNTGAPRSFGGSTTKYDFYNIGLSAGFKQRFAAGSGSFYYLFGLRGEYNVKNSFSQFKDLPENIQAFFPSEVGVNDFTFGFIFGGGFEFPLSPYIDATVELTVNPDYTKQYFQPPGSAYDPYTRNIHPLPERNIRNNSIELSIGFRFLRLVEYVD